MQKFEKMPFNEDVVTALENLLLLAKEGRVNWLGYAYCEGPIYGGDGFVGELSGFYAGHYGLLHCAKRVMERLDLLQGPGSKLDGRPANMYCYDVSLEPVCHDFIAWLVTVKMMQAREGMAGPTKICFTRNEAVDSMIDSSNRPEFFKSVMVPALTLFDCEQDKAAKEGRRHNSYTYREIVEAARRGENVPSINVPPATMEAMRVHLRGVEPVVITLREHRYWQHRNSDLDEWLKFAEWLKARGEHVIFVRDYAKAEEDIEGFDTMPGASRDFAVRAALYEHAKCNFFVSNGPASLALFGSRSWVQFIDCHEGEGMAYIQNTPRWWRSNHGIGPGEQFPWSGPNQRIVWERDTFKAMVESWEFQMECRRYAA